MSNERKERKHKEGMKQSKKEVIEFNIPERVQPQRFSY